MNYGLLVLGIFIGVAIIVTVDVTVSVAAIERGASAYPNMAPPVRYLFIPVLGAIIAAPAVIIHAVIGIFHKRHFHPAVWFAFGLAFSTFLLFLALRYAPGGPSFHIALSLTMAVFLVTSIRLLCGRRMEKHAV